MPLVTLTVMPAIAHAANASGFVLADDAAWCEHMAAGGFYTDPQIVTRLAQRFDSLRAESRAWRTDCWWEASVSLASSAFVSTSDTAPVLAGQEPRGQAGVRDDGEAVSFGDAAQVEMTAPERLPREASHSPMIVSDSPPAWPGTQHE